MSKAEKQPRLLYFSGAPMDEEYQNGVFTTNKQVLDHLQEESWKVEIISPRTPGSYDRYADYPVTHVSSGRAQDLPFGTGGHQKIPTLLNRFKPDAVFMNAPSGTSSSLLTLHAGLRGIPIIDNFATDIPAYAANFPDGAYEDFREGPVSKKHSDFPLPLRMGAAMGSYAMRTFGHKERPEDVIARQVATYFSILHNQAIINLAPSRSAAANLISYGVGEQSVRLWGRGVDTVRFNTTRRNSASVQLLRQSVLKGQDVPIVGYFGRVAAEKNLEDLAYLADLPARLLIIGDGLYMPELQKMLGDKAMFLGKLAGEALADGVAAMDIDVHTGRFETFGQTLQEAKATGIPVVAVDQGGPKDLIEHGETGFLYNPEHKGEIRQYVETLIHHPELRERMGAQARASVEGLSWRSLGQQFEGHIHDAITLKKTKRYRGSSNNTDKKG